MKGKVVGKMHHVDGMTCRCVARPHLDLHAGGLLQGWGTAAWGLEGIDHKSAKRLGGCRLG